MTKKPIRTRDNARLVARKKSVLKFSYSATQALKNAPWSAGKEQ